jgi:hypothetical protein
MAAADCSSMVAYLITSGRAVDLILLVMLVEAAVLLLLRRRIGRGPGPAELLAFLTAGAALLVALRAALVGAGWGWIALCLVVALLAHAASLALRWRQ